MLLPPFLHNTVAVPRCQILLLLIVYFQLLLLSQLERKNNKILSFSDYDW